MIKKVRIKYYSIKLEMKKLTISIQYMLLLSSILFIGAGPLFKNLLMSPNFRVTVVGDSDTVEICGALKNIVAVGAGFVDGMKCGDNTKSAVIRIGLMEMIRYCKVRFKT